VAHLVAGWVENCSNEPDSRFDRGGGGKIRLESAARQALSRFGSETQPANSDYPLLGVVVGGRGRIVLETLSWIGAIARRYGLPDHLPGSLGRTADRRGRGLF
jgi:hypothetical protein